jgi:hypothetical protein
MQKKIGMVFPLGAHHNKKGIIIIIIIIIIKCSLIRQFLKLDNPQP